MLNLMFIYIKIISRGNTREPDQYGLVLSDYKYVIEYPVMEKEISSFDLPKSTFQYVMHILIVCHMTNTCTW